jgi:hypothetical protein
MALTGTFEDISFGELLQLLNVGHKSGRLTVWRGAEKADVFIREGEVVRALSRRERGPEVVYRILGWQDGEFSFERSEEPVLREITESTEHLILEGMKRYDEWEHLETEMPDMHVILRQRAFAVNEQFDALSPEAQTVLRLVDARRNVATIIRESGLDPAAAFKAVTELLVEGIVEEWTQSAREGQVIAAKNHLPEANGDIDFHSGSYFASKQQLTKAKNAAGVAADQDIRRAQLPRK